MKSMSLSERLIEKLKTKADEIEWNYITSWRYERVLDDLAKMISDQLSREFPEADIGCSILYCRSGSTYYVGGSSTDRQTMGNTAKYYYIDENTITSSFTCFSIYHNVHCVFDNFKISSDILLDHIRHEQKNCELSSGDTKSYLFIPSYEINDTKKIVEDKDNLRMIEEVKNHLDNGPDQRRTGLRVSASKEGLASKIKEKLEPEFLETFFEIINKGQDLATANVRNNESFAIADFLYDLLQYRNREFLGLEKLVFHLQSLFDHSECSVFLAYRKKRENENLYDVRLHMVATTALSDSEQHKKFREGFINNNLHYTCYFDSEFKPVNKDGGLLSKNEWAKTERAYYEYDMPYIENELTTSRRFNDIGEMRESGSFLAIAIPPREDQERSLPYGVVRLVRQPGYEFSENDLQLASAIARGLTYWLDFFPMREDLEIKWANDKLKNKSIRTLFRLPKLTPERLDSGIESDAQRKAFERSELEFSWLMQRIFHKCRSINIKQKFSGRSGAIVLLVENDYGLDLILKCVRKEPSRKYEENPLVKEINNYSSYIEGRLSLNHNIIYPELIRETRNIIGFATSFINSQTQEMLSLTNFCKMHKGQYSFIELSVTRIVEKLVCEVWAWWYKPNPMSYKMKIEDFVYNELIKSDPIFYFFNDMKKFDQRILPSLNEVLDITTYDHLQTPLESRFSTPSEMWEEFKNSIKNCQKEITWQRTVTHGDTHGENIFFNTHSFDMWIMDFERTTERINIFDLALIESDLKFAQLANILDEEEAIANESFLQDFTAFERCLARQKQYEILNLPPISNYEALQCIGKIIVDIRQIACQKLQRTGCFDDYKLLLLLIAFKYMKLEDISNYRRALSYLSARSIIQSYIHRNQSS